MVIMGNNAAGVLNKKESLYQCIRKYSPGVIFIQESKCCMKGLLKLEDYVVFEKIRPKGGGGGLLTAVHSKLEPVVIEVNANNSEVLVIEAKIGNKDTRLINAYGPQEEESGGDKKKLKNSITSLILL